MKVVTRFAPSPTGYLHIWSLRTVLYNYLFAKKNDGRFIVRIEDTDKTRFVEWSVDNMLEVLASVWLIPDEWPNNPWNLWPYYQSERLHIYKKYVDELIEKDKAYYCFCSSERLDKLREQQQSMNLPTKYDKKCRFLSNNEIEQKLKSWETYTIRLKVPENREIEFRDLIKWKIKVSSKDIDDQIILKTDWYPTYHLANVVDDYLMWISHVIRWDEWTPSTAKHVIMYEAFWWEVPIFSHIPLLLWKDKKKLSKRTGDVSVKSYMEKGYLSESIINYIALLGWNPKTTEEFFNIEELIKRFDLSQVHKSWAVFDLDRLNFFNSYYIKNLDINYLYDKLLNYLSRYDSIFLEKIQKFDESYNKKVLEEIKSKIKKFDEFREFTSYFYDEPGILDQEIFVNEKMKISDLDMVKKSLDISLLILENKNDFESISEIKNLFIEEIKLKNMKNWQVLWPVRCALSWEVYSPWALEMIFILGREKSIFRIKKVLEFFEK